MRPSLEDLRAFIFVADTGSVVRAAERLNLTQSALSKRLIKLEECINAQLIDRSKRVLTLTEVGRDFLPVATRILHSFDAALDELGDVVARRHGRVTISCLRTVANSLLPPVLIDFQSDYPGIQLRVLDGSGDRVVGAIKTGGAEFGIDMGRPWESSIEFTPLLEDPFVVGLPIGHPLTRKDSLSFADLEEGKFIRLGLESSVGRYLDSIFEATGVFPRWTMEAQHISTMIGLIEIGAGVGLLPLSVAAQHADKRLSIKTFDSPAMVRTIGIIRRRDHELSPAAAQLHERLVTTLRRPGFVERHIWAGQARQDG